ncbi:hypothetical protein ACX9R5_10635 [Rathayibacter sp. CAU 1779]
MAEEQASRPWDEAAYRQLFDALYEGLDDEELSERLGRTASAVSSVCSRLLTTLRAMDPEAELPGKGLDGLRALISGESEQDWVPLAREMHKRAGRVFWGAEEDAVLAAAWTSGRETLTGVASQLGTGDGAVLARLVWLGLARDRDDAIQHLGVDAGSLIDVRRRLAAGDAVEQWVLTLTEPAGTTVHVSLHHAEADARAAIEREAPRALKRGALESVRWNLACRVMGWSSDDAVETGVVQQVVE